MHSLEFSDRCRGHEQHHHHGQQLVHIHGSDGSIVHYVGHERCASTSAVHAQHSLNQKTDTLLLFIRSITFCCSLASLIVMVTNFFSSSSRLTWSDFDAYRYVSAANSIICLYSLAEIGLALWYLYKGRTLMPELIARWFDFGHDQGFAYLILSACSAATEVAQNLRGENLLVRDIKGCQGNESFCKRAEISIGFAFGAFSFIAFSSLISGYRLAKWLLIGL